MRSLEIGWVRPKSGAGSVPLSQHQKAQMLPHNTNTEQERIKGIRTAVVRQSHEYENIPAPIEQGGSTS